MKHPNKCYLVMGPSRFKKVVQMRPADEFLSLTEALISLFQSHVSFQSPPKLLHSFSNIKM